MITHELIQGTPEWLAHRAQHFNASDAPAMMGVSPYKTRAELLREMHTGVVPQVDKGTEKRFDAGHRLEALARPLAEEFIGSELYPVTGSDGRLSASLDGLTLDESEGLEHKHLNAELKAIFASGTDDECGRLLPAMHRVQMEQQLLVSGARRILFMTSDWTADDALVEEHHCWYYTDTALRQQIVDGWAQFERDLAAYVLPPSADAAPVGKTPETLPALRIEVTGKVTASNLAEFKETALAAIRSIDRELITDAQFANAEQAVKWCADVESRLQAAKQHALSQTASIDALFKAIDDISAEARRVRLDLDKLVTRRKTEVREEAVSRARSALDKHIATLNAEMVPMRLLPVQADFAGAIKGRRTLTSMQDALDSTLVVAKIAAENEARAMRGNLSTFKERAAGFEFLFADLGQIVHKAADDFGTLVQARIDAHKAAEAEKARKAQEAELLRAEAAERQAREAAERAAAQAAAAPAPLQSQPTAAPAPLQSQPTAAPAVASAAQPQQQAAPAPRISATQCSDEPATLLLGTICERLGFTVSAAFLDEVLHVAPAKTDKAAKLYRESQFALICSQLSSHVGAMAELYAADAAPA